MELVKRAVSGGSCYADEKQAEAGQAALMGGTCIAVVVCLRGYPSLCPVLLTLHALEEDLRLQLYCLPAMHLAVLSLSQHCLAHNVACAVLAHTNACGLEATARGYMGAVLQA